MLPGVDLQTLRPTVSGTLATTDHETDSPLPDILQDNSSGRADFLSGIDTHPDPILLLWPVEVVPRVPGVQRQVSGRMQRQW